jgi:hypothetical protein
MLKSEGKVYAMEIRYRCVRKWLLLGQSAMIVCGVICLLGLVTPAKAGNLVMNGSFESTTLDNPGGYFCQAGPTCVSNVTDWNSVCNAGGCGNGSTVLSLLFAGTNGGAFNGDIGLWGPIADSPDGGNFVGADGDPQYSAAFSQEINGLDVGQSYILTFDQAAAQQNGTSGATTEKWQVSLGSETQDSAVMDNPSHGFQAWNQQTMTFTATATSELLTFLAVGTPGGEPPVSLLDGVSMVSSAAPEPANLVLAVAGLVGLAVLRARRRART